VAVARHGTDNMDLFIFRQKWDKAIITVVEKRYQIMSMRPHTPDSTDAIKLPLYRQHHFDTTNGQREGARTISYLMHVIL